MKYWINGTPGYKAIVFNGCSKHNDCFSCPFADCVAPSNECKEEKHDRTVRNKAKNYKDPQKHEYYEKNRKRILEQQRLKREEKRRAKRLEQQAVG